MTESHRSSHGRRREPIRESPISMRMFADAVGAAAEPPWMQEEVTVKRLWILAVIAGALAMCAEASGQTLKPDVRAAARSDTALRVVVSLSVRRLWVVTGAEDTLLAVPVAV